MERLIDVLAAIIAGIPFVVVSIVPERTGTLVRWTGIVALAVSALAFMWASGYHHGAAETQDKVAALHPDQFQFAAAVPSADGPPIWTWFLWAWSAVYLLAIAATGEIADYLRRAKVR